MFLLLLANTAFGKSDKLSSRVSAVRKMIAGNNPMKRLMDQTSFSLYRYFLINWQLGIKPPCSDRMDCAGSAQQISADQLYDFSRFSNLVPLQRGLVLKELNMTLHDLLFAEEEDFLAAISRQTLSIGTELQAVNRVGNLLIDTDLGRYFPSAYHLSAEDVLNSAEVFDDFVSIPDRQQRPISFVNVAALLNILMANTGRHDIIESLNKLDFDEMKEFMHKVNVRWMMVRVSQASHGYDFFFEQEQVQLPGKLDQSHLDHELKIIIKAEQYRLDEWKEQRNRRQFSDPPEEKIKQLERHVNELKRLDAMPNSLARETAIVKFFADYLTSNIMTHRAVDKVTEALGRNKIGQAVLEDLTPFTIVALQQLINLYYGIYYLGHAPFIFDLMIDLQDRESRRQHLLDLVDAELQKAIADK